jgi:hypothetical protein
MVRVEWEWHFNPVGWVTWELADRFGAFKVVSLRNVDSFGSWEWGEIGALTRAAHFFGPGKLSGRVGDVLD